jgi:hypothetical protein
MDDELIAKPSCRHCDPAQQVYVKHVKIRTHKRRRYKRNRLLTCTCFARPKSATFSTAVLYSQRGSGWQGGRQPRSNRFATIGLLNVSKVAQPFIEERARLKMSKSWTALDSKIQRLKMRIIT